MQTSQKMQMQTATSTTRCRHQGNESCDPNNKEHASHDQKTAPALRIDSASISSLNIAAIHSCTLEVLQKAELLQAVRAHRRGSLPRSTIKTHPPHPTNACMTTHHAHERGKEHTPELHMSQPGVSHTTNNPRPIRTPALGLSEPPTPGQKGVPALGHVTSQKGRHHVTSAGTPTCTSRRSTTNTYNSIWDTHKFIYKSGGWTREA